MSENNSKLKGIILDMDGVITQTATLHAKAWKEMFDEFLKEKEGSNFTPLDIEEDYKKYIDGIPRFDGVRKFLKSRDIELPEGSPDDPLEKDTVYGLGMRKNKIFRSILKKEGVKVFDDALEMIKKWRSENIKLAVISSSRNCKYVLRAAGLTEYFHARVDGQTSEEADLEGKPEPDIFLRATDLLGTSTDETVVIEDAIAGVQAAKKGGFSLVVGVERNGNANALKEAGADLVVEKITQLESEVPFSQEGEKPEDLPDALESFEDIYNALASKKPVLFLDYDGTLTPIVSDPEKAVISDKAKKVLKELSHKITVTILSGRDRKNLKSKVQIDSIIYAGSHGFDITGPNGLEMQYEGGKKALPELDKAEKNLQKALSKIKGAQVERKEFAIAVHFRNVDQENEEQVKNVVYDELEQHDNLKEGTGKKILELKPDIDWHKGKALQWLMKKLDLKPEQYMPFFIGDDITDEDALEAIKNTGIGIVSGSHGQKTSADYQLKDTDAVIQFLDQLNQRIA